MINITHTYITEYNFYTEMLQHTNLFVRCKLWNMLQNENRQSLRFCFLKAHDVPFVDLAAGPLNLSQLLRFLLEKGVSGNSLTALWLALLCS